MSQTRLGELTSIMNELLETLEYNKNRRITPGITERAFDYLEKLSNSEGICKVSRETHINTAYGQVIKCLKDAIRVERTKLARSHKVKQIKIASPENGGGDDDEEDDDGSDEEYVMSNGFLIPVRNLNPYDRVAVEERSQSHAPFNKKEFAEIIVELYKDLNHPEFWESNFVPHPKTKNKFEMKNGGKPPCKTRKTRKPRKTRKHRKTYRK
jgi:hypothetical protein